MSCRMKSDQQMLLKRGRIPDALLVTNKVSPRLQFASACWRSTGHWIGTVRPAGRLFELALFMDAKLDVSKGAYKEGNRGLDRRYSTKYLA